MVGVCFNGRLKKACVCVGWAHPGMQGHEARLFMRRSEPRHGEKAAHQATVIVGVGIGGDGRKMGVSCHKDG